MKHTFAQNKFSCKPYGLRQKR